MAQKAAQRHFDGLSEVTSALHRHSHHELRRRCRLKPDPNLQGGKFSSEGNRGLLILQPVTANCERSQTHVYVLWTRHFMPIVLLVSLFDSDLDFNVS